MSLQDPIADMLIRIKNAQAVFKKSVSMPKSKIKLAIAKVLQEEGYITGYSETVDQDKAWSMSVELKYFNGQPVIRRLERVSRPSLRAYQSVKKLPTVANGLGIAIVSTSKGVMTAKDASKISQGGEILCYVS